MLGDVKLPPVPLILKSTTPTDTCLLSTFVEDNVNVLPPTVEPVTVIVCGLFQLDDVNVK